MTEVPEFPRPPAHVEPYVRILGLDRAMAFLTAYGGAEVYLARNPDPAGPLAELVGIDGARGLGAAYARLPRRVPVAKPWLAACLRAQGQTVSHIARHLRVTDVTVRNWLRTADQRAGIAPRRDRPQ